MELVGAAEPGRHAAAMRVKLARTVSGDDEVQAGEEDAPDGRETEPHDSWWRAHKVIYASRLARTTAATARLQRAAVRRSGPAAAAASAAGTGGAAADPSGLTGSTTVQARSSALAFSWNRHLSFPIFALAFWPSFTRDLEWEYFFYSIAASRGSIARVCAYLAVQAAGEVLFLSINARHDAAGPTQVAAGAPHAIVFFFGRLVRDTHAGPWRGWGVWDEEALALSWAEPDAPFLPPAPFPTSPFPSLVPPGRRDAPASA
jgi:hypothetical protein